MVYVNSMFNLLLFLIIVQYALLSIGTTAGVCSSSSNSCQGNFYLSLKTLFPRFLIPIIVVGVPNTIMGFFTIGLGHDLDSRKMRWLGIGFLCLVGWMFGYVFYWKQTKSLAKKYDIDPEQIKLRQTLFHISLSVWVNLFMSLIIGGFVYLHFYPQQSNPTPKIEMAWLVTLIIGSFYTLPLFLTNFFTCIVIMKSRNIQKGSGLSVLGFILIFTLIIGSSVGLVKWLSLRKYIKAVEKENKEKSLRALDYWNENLI